MLLYTVSAPTSFQLLKTYDSVIYSTFQAACAARGLLDTDDEWDRCLQEAELIRTDRQLRQLFAAILLNNSPLHPNELLHRHMDNLSDDYRYRLQRDFHIDTPTQEQIQSLTLYELDTSLRRAGKTLADYHLISPSVHFDDSNDISRIIAEEKNYDLLQLTAKWNQGQLSANSQQNKILDAVISTVESDNTGLFFIDGPGGTGKTFVENLILARVRSTGRIALSIASSDIASLLLDGGRTSHSRFKIPIDIHADSICSVAAQSDLAKLLQLTSLIIWDEAPAQHRHCFQAVDRTLKDLRKDSRWFDGITVVFADMFLIYVFRFSNLTHQFYLEDFRQCLPVVSKATRAQIVAATIVYTPFWKDVKVMSLSVNMRLLAQADHMTELEHRHATEFAAWQLKLGQETANHDDFMIKLSMSMKMISVFADISLDLCLSESENQVSDLIDMIYPHINTLHEISEDER